MNYSGTLSVIDKTTNTVTENITVGVLPRAVYAGWNFIYVVNSGSNTVSVINATTNEVIKNITVGESPYHIDGNSDAMYVANSESNTVSVINATTNDVIKKNITVGDGPRYINSFGEPVFVANSDSNTVSVINSLTNEVVAGVTFDSNPFSGGQIICNGLVAPINSYFYISSGTECTAKPNNGYEFTSWVQNSEDNSTRTVSAPASSDSLLDLLRDAFSDDPAANLTRTVSAPASSGSPLALEALRDAFTDDPAATLTVNRFGNFTAYFKALPPPVPAEYLASLFTVVVTAIVGSLLIPAAIGWIKSRKQTSRLNSIHQQMADVYDDGKVDKNDVDQLNTLNKNISDSYSAGKITSDQYSSLKNEVSTAFHEIFKKRIELITEQDLETIDTMRNDAVYAYNNGKLNSEHYQDLKNEVSNTYQRIFKKRIELVTDPTTKAVSKIKNDIEDAYSDRKITELDYNLLNGKILRMLDNN